ncbi:hypothetical protein [Lacrimispora sp.]|jgi:hypothetical protein|uniref:hypothetical protein n=1 Tax=Lacrimispora sp. TaxID=2719234 RepID=UPI0028AA3DDB|nr:hypothetical protein [Lacrimispora sp.]
MGDFGCESCQDNLQETFENNLQNGHGDNELGSILWFLFKKVYWTGYEQGCHDAPFCRCDHRR